MKSLSKIKNRLNETWDNFTEGWNRLTQLSGNALTRFTNPIKTKEEKDHPQRYLQQWDHGVGWSLLPVDLYEDDNSIQINLEAPGISSNDLSIYVVGDQLVIEGNKNIRREEKRGQFYIMECAYGHFNRTIPLPCSVDDKKAKATYKHGVLNVTLPKTVNTKKIQILVE